jgi:two-component system, NarL family, nitrate/nitrite response regulator NarL
MTESSPIRVLIADDHAIFRAGLRLLLETVERVQVVGEAADGDQVVELSQRLKPDLLILDLAMGRRGGLDALRTLRSISLPMRTIILTGSISKTQEIEAVLLGVRGIMLKESAAELLARCLHTVLAGQYWIGHESIGNIIEAFRASRPSIEGLPSLLAPQQFGLTAREFEVISAVVAGLSNKEIAYRLSLSEDTIKHHLTNIFGKVGVSSRMELSRKITQTTLSRQD